MTACPEWGGPHRFTDIQEAEPDTNTPASGRCDCGAIRTLRAPMVSAVRARLITGRRSPGGWRLSDNDSPAIDKEVGW